MRDGSLQIVFFGTSGFACPVLRRVHSEGHTIVAVVTPPPRPAGRGRKLQPSPVQVAAGELGLPLLQPENPNDAEFVTRFAGIKPDLALLVAYGYILKQPLLGVPRHGFINLHPSLLPRYRGAAPIQRALIDGVAETGITVLRMNVKVDAGDILYQEKTDVGPDETAAELSDRLAEIGAIAVAGTIDRIGTEALHPAPQDPALVTRAPKIADADRPLHWQHPARELHNLVRALSPAPGAVAKFRDRPVTVTRSRVLDTTADARPGSIATAPRDLAVVTGSGALELTELKLEGGKLQSGRSFRNGQRLTPEDRFEDG